MFFFINFPGFGASEPLDPYSKNSKRREIIGKAK